MKIKVITEEDKKAGRGIVNSDKIKPIIKADLSIVIVENENIASKSETFFLIETEDNVIMSVPLTPNEMKNFVSIYFSVTNRFLEESIKPKNENNGSGS